MKVRIIIDLFDEVAKKFNLETNINLIEVYDNSHIQGTNSVGALNCLW